MRLIDGAILAIFSNETSRFAPRTLLPLLKFQGYKVSPRTLARRLDDLVRHGELVSEGNTRNLVYLRPGRRFSGRDVPEHLCNSSSQRTPSTYERGFLEGYRPNVDFYLPEALREKLLRQGRTMSGEHSAGTYAQSILGRFLVDLAWASSALEGNTYSWLETQELVGAGKAAEDKQPAETVMIQNHKAAIEWLVNSSPRFDKSAICNLHAFLSQGLLVDPYYEGTPCDKPGTVAAPHSPRGVSEEEKIGPMFDILLEKAGAIVDPFEQAFFAMVHIPYLHPFIDANKCTSRLAANIPLIRANLRPLSFVDMPRENCLASLSDTYGLQQAGFLCDVFEQAYLRSCERYPAVNANIDPPGLLEARYRELLGATVYAVVTGASVDARFAIERVLGEVAPEHRAAFAGYVKRRLDALHEHNLARYRLSPAQFRAWRDGRKE